MSALGQSWWETAASWWQDDEAPGLSTVVQCGPGMAGQLCREATTQIDLAEQGNGLPNALAGGTPQFLVDAPSNNLGAAYRAAYWLGVAARVAMGRQQPQQGAALLAKARAARGRAVNLTTQKFTWGLFGTSATGDGKVKKILRDAEKAARQHGVNDVAQILDMQQQNAAIEQAQLQTAGEGAMTVPGLDPTRIAQGIVGGGTATIVIGAVILGGIALWFAWPWLSPIFGLAGQAARSAGGAVKARRRKAPKRRRKRRRR